MLYATTKSTSQSRSLFIFGNGNRLLQNLSRQDDPGRTFYSSRKEKGKIHPNLTLNVEEAEKLICAGNVAADSYYNVTSLTQDYLLISTQVTFQSEH